MPQLGAPELLIIFVIVFLLFGVGRIGKIAGELGSGIRAFREGLEGKEENKPEPKPEEAKETLAVIVPNEEFVGSHKDIGD